MPSAKAAEAIRASLGRLFGAEVEVHYYDVGTLVVAEAYADLLGEWSRLGIPLPVVMLDTTIIYAGTIDPLHVVVAVARAHGRRRAAQAG